MLCLWECSSCSCMSLVAVPLNPTHISPPCVSLSSFHSHNTLPNQPTNRPILVLSLVFSHSLKWLRHKSGGSTLRQGCARQVLARPVLSMQTVCKCVGTVEDGVEINWNNERVRQGGESCVSDDLGDRQGEHRMDMFHLGGGEKTYKNTGSKDKRPNIYMRERRGYQNHTGNVPTWCTQDTDID